MGLCGARVRFFPVGWCAFPQGPKVRGGRGGNARGGPTDPHQNDPSSHVPTSWAEAKGSSRKGPVTEGVALAAPEGAGLAWRGQDGPPASWIFLAPPPGTGEHSLARRGARSPSPPVASRKPRPAVGRALSAGLLVLATSSFDKPSAQAPRRNRKHAPGFVGARSVSVAAVPCFHVSLGTSRGEAVRFLEDRV